MDGDRILLSMHGCTHFNFTDSRRVRPMILDIDFVIPYRAASWKRSLQGARDKLAWSGDYTASLEPRLIKVNLKLAWGRL